MYRLHIQGQPRSLVCQVQVPQRGLRWQSRLLAHSALRLAGTPCARAKAKLEAFLHIFSSLKAQDPRSQPSMDGAARPSLASRRSCKLALKPLDVACCSQEAVDEPLALQPVEHLAREGKPPIARKRRTDKVRYVSPFEEVSQASASAFTPTMPPLAKRPKRPLSQAHSSCSEQSTAEHAGSQCDSLPTAASEARSCSPELSIQLTTPSLLSATTSLDSHAADVLSQSATKATTATSSACQLASRRKFHIQSLQVDPQPTTMPQQPQVSQHELEAARQEARTCIETKQRFGWFRPCRGCSQQTANEYICLTVAAARTRGIPLCAPCCRNMSCIQGTDLPRFETQLVHINACWSQHGF